MKRISLSEVEVSDLLDLYQSEIDRAQRRINNLKSIVKKISEGKTVDHEEEKPAKDEVIKAEPKKRGRKPKTKIIKTKAEKEITIEPKKRGRKPKAKVEVVKSEPKKRGPKPKIKAVETKAEVEVEKKQKEKPTKIKATSRKRGRKPKVVSEKAAVANVKKESRVITKGKKVATNKKVLKVKSEPKKTVRKSKSLRKPIKAGKGKDKVKWNVFINETITSKDSLMLASSITQAALEKFEIPASDRDRVRMAISTTLTKMANKDKVLQTYTQAGIRGAFFGLAKWFNDKGELNNDYKKKLM